MPPQPDRHGDSAIGVSDGAGGSRTIDSPAGAPHGKGNPHQMSRTGGVDEERIQQDVHEVYPQSHLHGRSGVTNSPEHHAEQNVHGAKQHTQIQNAEILRRRIPDCGRHLHPPDDGAAETGGENRQDDSHCQCHEGRLGGGSFGSFLLSRADRLGNIGQKAHAQRRYGAVYQPGNRAGSPHRCCRLGAQRADHGGVDILHRRLHQLLQHGRPGQCENDAQHRGIQPLFTHDFSFCFHSMLFIQYTENDSQLQEGSASKPPAPTGGFLYVLLGYGCSGRNARRY